jgi:carbonic anhydrase
MPIRRRVDACELAVVGAIYHVETGEVEFLDQPDLGS